MKSKRLQNVIQNALYPQGIYCISCNHPIAPGMPYDLCTDCFRAFHWANETVCDRCGRPLDNVTEKTPSQAGEPAHLCTNCKQQAPGFHKGYAVTGYDLWERELLYRFKYGNCAYYAESMAAMMADLLTAKQAGPYDCLVPVPIHETRLKERGYNQAACLAESLAGRIGAPVASQMLQRAKQTQALKTMNRTERMVALKGVFALGPDAERQPPAGKHILLIDDILTTGATASACAEVLLRAGASRVDLAVFSAVSDGGIAQVCG